MPKAAPKTPPTKRGTCRTCHGPITHYARRDDDVPPHTTAVNEEDRWAHDRTSDWLHQPHRAKPAVP